MTHTSDLINQQKGFTLVEMAIVLMIVGLLLGGLLVPLSAQMEQRNVTETRKQLDEIQQALVGFAIINGRLPCPAQATVVTGQTNAGMEAFNGNTCTCLILTGVNNTVADNSATKVACDLTATAVTGVLPWVTLGVNETDAWGNRYTYRVTKDFADAVVSSTFTSNCPVGTTATQSSFALCSIGNLNVLSAAPPAANTTIASNVPTVIISHGKNGAGAYTQQGIKLPVGGDLDEQENSDNNNSFVSHTFTPTFDDFVVWISPNILINRMVAAGKLP